MKLHPNKAHVFQHNTSEVQIFVYYAVDEFDAKSQFKYIVMNQYDWTYLGEKTAQDA